MKPDKPPLDSDQLGALGEARFEALCAAANLVANKSNRDKVGWDYVVTFPQEAEASAPLDSRKAPFSCHVQVKTVWDWNNEFKVKLSAAEWIAKEPKPSFFCVVRISKELEVTDSYLVHLIEGPLATVLRRLRLEFSRGTLAINEKVISMSIRKGRQISWHPSTFRSAISEAIGSDFQKYIVEKERQVKELGFEEGAVQLKVNLHLESDDQLVDAMLGLGGEIRGTELRTTETRFGITLPIHSYKEALLKFEPHSDNNSTVVVRSSAFEIPAVFKSKAYFPGIPDLPFEKFKVRIASDLFSIVMKQGEYSVSTDLGSRSLSFSDWVDFWKLQLALTSSDGEIETRVEGKPTALTIPIATVRDDDAAKKCKRFLLASECGARLVRLAGLAKEPLLPSWRLGGRLSQHLVFVGSLAGFNDENVSLTVSKIESASPENGETVEVVFVGYLPLGDVTLGYSAKVSLKIEVLAGEITGTSTRWQFDGIHTLHGFPDTYDAFIQKSIEKSGLKQHLAIPLPKPKPLLANTRLLT